MTMTMRAGEVSILNCTTGDTKISFDSNKPEEVERAKAVVEDMLRRGYCLSVVVGDRMERAVAFDAKSCEYVVQSTSGVEKKPSRKGRPPKRRVSAFTGQVVAVGQTAGGGLGCPSFEPDLEAVRSSSRARS